ncbi:MAG: hypothetical protein Q8P50_12300 [Bacillota bacterium]|nr:hypothetical protein [Bacillota bacterium]
MKEQIVHGRVFRDLEEVRAALRAFVELYNRECLLSISSWTSTERNTELPMLLVCKVVKRDGRYQGVSMVGFRGS